MNKNEMHTRLCIHCSGSGEGMHDGSRCLFCSGRGVIFYSEYICPTCDQNN